MFTADGRKYGRRTSSLKCGVGSTSGRNATPIQGQEDDLGALGQTYGNRLLSLRVALNEKELQLVELREQHISVVNRAATARRNWEDAIKSKDRVILELRRALHVQKCEFDRQERVNEENVQRLNHERKAQENAELEQKQRCILLLEQKNAHFVEELVEQQKAIAKVRRQYEARERQFASYLHKMEAMNVRVQDMNAALQKKDAIIESQKMHCQELKGLVWKRDAMIGQLQLAEQQLQSALAKQEADHEALKCLKEKVLGEKIQAEKNLAQLKENYEHLDSAALHKKCESRLQEKEGFLRTQRRQIFDLQKALQSKETALDNNRKDKRQQYDEAMRVVHRYELLRQELEHSRRKQQQLEMELENVQERLLAAEMAVEAAERSSAVILQNAESSEVSVSEDNVDDTGGDSCGSEVSSLKLRDTAIRMASTAKSTPNKSVLPPSRGSDSAKLHYPSFSSAKDKSSVSRQGESRNKLKPSVSPSDANNCLSTADYEMEVPNGNRGYMLGKPTGFTYPSTPDATDKVAGEGRAAASTAEAHQLGIDGHIGKTGEASDTDSSYGSSRASSCIEVDLHSSSDVDQRKYGERRLNQIESMNVASGARRGKNLLNSRDTAGSRRKVPSQTSMLNRKRASLLVSNGSAMPYKTSVNGDLEGSEGTGPAKFSSSTKQFQAVKKSKVPASNGKSAVPRHSSAEVVGDGNSAVGKELEPVASPRQENGFTANDLTKPEYSAPHQNFHTSAKKFPRASAHRRAMQSSKPPAPTLMSFHSSGDATLKSLQEEVVKREKGWRKTEASIRAALCQRLKDLKEAEKNSLHVYD